MNTAKPNRDGWVIGALAEQPPCPPLPAFTQFERKALDCIAAEFANEEAAFREQVASAEVTDRINTAVGFYTRVRVDRTKQGAHFDVEGVEHGLGVILWDKSGDGYLDTIEGYTYDDDPLAGVNLADLKFVRLVHLG